MKIAVAGGNGFIGRRLTEQLREHGHEIVWLSHTPGRFPLQPGVDEVVFSPLDVTGAWVAHVASADAVVNLSGYPIASRWNPRVKRLLVSSRIETTAGLVRVITEARAEGRGPSVFVCASGIGIYGEGGEQVLDEAAPLGTDWLAQLALAWEREALAAEQSGCRTVVVRTGLVLGDQGLVPKMALPMRLFVGGPVGSGEQWVPWIAHEDVARTYGFALENDALRGPVNACAPDPVRMRDFSKALGRALHRPSWFPVPDIGLRLVLGEVAPYTLFSQRAACAKLQAAGFEFALPSLEDALRASV